MNESHIRRQRFISTVFGDVRRFSLQQSGVIGVSLFSAVGLVIGGIFNVVLSMPGTVVAGTFLLALLFALFYYLARFKDVYRPLFWPLTGTGCLLITLLWIYNAGLSGPAPVWAPITIGVVMVIGDGSQRYWGAGALVLLTGGLIVSEIAFPDMTVAYTSRMDWLVDSMVTFIIAALIVSAMLLFLIHSYHQQRTEAKNSFARLMEANEKLTQALKEVNILSGLLPVCASCKKVRDDKGYWNQIDEYIQEHSQARVTHSICPACAKKLYPELDLSDPEPPGR